MRETELQKLTIDVVRERGGAGHKLSSQFAIGVCDLLIKLRNTNEPILPHNFFDRPGLHPAMLLEVKAHMGVWDNGQTFTLDVTVPQRTFLRKFNDAGMRTGVLSFLYKGGKRQLAAQVFTLDELEQVRYRVETARHWPLGDHTTRDDMLYKILKEYANQ